MTEDEMAGWYHRLDGHETEQAPGKIDKTELNTSFSKTFQKKC